MRRAGPYQDMSEQAKKQRSPNCQSVNPNLGAKPGRATVGAKSWLSINSTLSPKTQRICALWNVESTSEDAGLQALAAESPLQ